ncbi:unnamed protein product [Soboliphyme baturini]|uniref:F-box/LRR-repeat protein 20 n=1 Tax=Soboliphyme baturini TaxID=241478 RepID=A0A183I9S0_9BILA|nr:unnamed protein product [Soboliphyme baturini]
MAGLVHLLSFSKRLTSLDLSGIQRHSLTRCFQHLHSGIKRLILNDCMQVNDPALRSIVQNCPHLEELGIRYCTSLTSRALNEAFRALGHLCVLNFSWYTNTAVDFMARSSLVSFDTLPCLVYLNLCANDLLNDTAIEMISNHCPQLRTLDVSRCANRVATESFLHLQKLRHLRKLNLSCTTVSDAVLAVLAATLKLNVRLRF